MSLTIKLTLLKRKKRKNGEIPIYLRFTEDRKSRYRSTGISIYPKYWNNNKKKVRKSHRRSKHLNIELNKKLREAEDLRDELYQKNNLTLQTLLKGLSKDERDDPNNLITLAENYRQSLKGTDRYHEWKRLSPLINNLKDFLGDRAISIDNVDASFIEEFQEFLLNDVKNNPNTVRRKLTSFKGMFLELLKRKEIKNDPFATVDKVSDQPADRVRLSLEQIQDIKNVDLKEGSRLWHVRNYFLYSFYNAGIRFGDLCCLEWSNIIDNRLAYTMKKTGGKKSIKQLEPMQHILSLYRDGGESSDDYIFPLLSQKYDNPFDLQRAIGSRNVRVNLLLKDLADRAGIKANISFHVSRHSFANYANKKNMGVYSISKALAHADLKTTQQYLDGFDEEKLDTDMEELFN
jgi:site-specific recombinase XerD